jgi:molecular chaperone GrpE (heat shock protein)
MMSKFVQALRRLITSRNEKNERLLEEARSLSLGVETRARRLYDSTMAEPPNEPDDRDLSSILRSACEFLDSIEERESVYETENQTERTLEQAYKLALEVRVRASELVGSPAHQTTLEEDNLISMLESTRYILDRLVKRHEAPKPFPDENTVTSFAKEVIRVRDSVLQAKLSDLSFGPDWLEGLYVKLGQVLEENGIVEINDTGRFDYDRQRILEVRPTDNPEQDEHVHSTVRPGYLVDKKILRPQEVIVYSYER